MNHFLCLCHKVPAARQRMRRPFREESNALRAGTCLDRMRFLHSEVLVFGGLPHPRTSVHMPSEQIRRPGKLFIPWPGQVGFFLQSEERRIAGKNY